MKENEQIQSNTKIRSRKLDMDSIEKKRKKRTVCSYLLLIFVFIWYPHKPGCQNTIEINKYIFTYVFVLNAAKWEHIKQQQQNQQVAQVYKSLDAHTRQCENISVFRFNAVN